MGKIPHLSLVASPLVTHGEFYFSPFVASPLMGKNPIPSPYPSFNSSLNLRHCFYDCIFKTMKYCMLILILFVIIMYIIILLNHIRKLYFVRIKPIDMFQKPTFSCCKNHYLEQEVQHIKNIKFVKYNYETNSYNIGHRYLPI